MKTLLICHDGAPLDQVVLARWLNSFSNLVGLVVNNPRAEFGAAHCARSNELGSFAGPLSEGLQNADQDACAGKKFIKHSSLRRRSCRMKLISFPYWFGCFPDDPQPRRAASRICRGSGAYTHYKRRIQGGISHCGQANRLHSSRKRWHIAPIRQGSEREKKPGNCYRKKKSSAWLFFG